MLTVPSPFTSARGSGDAVPNSPATKTLKTPRELLQNADPKRVKLIIIDLNGRRTEPVRAIEELKGSSAGGAIPILAFFSHVQTELAEEARKAGASWILPRSAFSARLAGILTDFKV